MAKEYIVISNEDSKQGMIALSKHVIETITQYAVEEEHDFDLPEEKMFRRPITCEIVDKKLEIVCNVKIRYGLNVTKSCEVLQSKIASALSLMTDLACSKIEINVVGFMF
ncbi:MAG: Asp23/Gls24 family envelope stress response protein [Erysipelotrichaceae bacterium]|nr:Asp23/Gls24 family envelope stress response protein [Erysipelotrichaceae bacterium]